MTAITGKEIVRWRNSMAIRTAIKTVLNTADTKAGRTIPRTSIYLMMDVPAVVIGTGWGRSGFIRAHTATAIVPDSEPDTIVKAGLGVTAMRPIFPWSMVATTAEFGQETKATRLDSGTAHWWPEKTFARANLTTPIHVGAMKAEHAITAANTQVAIEPGMNLRERGTDTVGK